MEGSRRVYLPLIFRRILDKYVGSSFFPHIMYTREVLSLLMTLSRALVKFPAVPALLLTQGTACHFAGGRERIAAAPESMRAESFTFCLESKVTITGAIKYACLLSAAWDNEVSSNGEWLPFRTVGSEAGKVFLRCCLGTS